MVSRRENWELERRLQTACLLIITAILCAFACYWMRAVLIPFVLALFLFQLLEPTVKMLKNRLRLPHALAVTLTLVCVGTAIFYASSVITNSVGQLFSSSDAYGARLSQLLEGIWERYPSLEERFKTLVQNQLAQFSDSVGSFLAALTNSVVYLISQSTVVLLFLMFLLFGSKRERSYTGVLLDIDTKVKNYVRVKTALSVITGLTVGLILNLLHVDLAFVFGLLAILLNFIPNVGSIIATLLPLPVILVDPSLGSVEATLAVLLPGILQFAVGNFLEPKLLGDSLNLSPIMILLSLAVWTALWGGVGALLAVPITAIIQILCEQMAFTQPVAAILSGDFFTLMNSHKEALEAPPSKAKNKKAIPSNEVEPNELEELYADIRKVEKKFS